MQINSTKNISKITASMKMVSAAKLKGDEARLALARPFNAWTTELCGEPKEMEEATYEELPERVLIVPFTSEKGLCGGVNSFITRGMKRCINILKKEGKDCDVVVFGDKGRSQLRRAIPDKIIRTDTEILSPGTFALASSLATELNAVNASEYDAVVLMYNSFINAAAYKQVYKVIKPFSSVGEETESLLEYEVEGVKDEIMSDLYEYMIASQIYHSFMDGAASEQSSRMTAMENASNNARDLIDKLTLKYNRARQARITTELIEIISGASALDD